jgi:hypothetical protein
MLLRGMISVLGFRWAPQLQLESDLFAHFCILLILQYTLGTNQLKKVEKTAKLTPQQNASLNTLIDGWK